MLVICNCTSKGYIYLRNVEAPKSTKFIFFLMGGDDLKPDNEPYVKIL